MGESAFVLLFEVLILQGSAMLYTIAQANQPFEKYIYIHIGLQSCEEQRSNLSINVTEISETMT